MALFNTSTGKGVSGNSGATGGGCTLTGLAGSNQKLAVIRRESTGPSLIRQWSTRPGR